MGRYDSLEQSLREGPFRGHDMRIHAADVIKELNEENERLMGENAMLKGDVQVLRGVIKRLPNPMDIVRLRRLLED